VVASLFGVNYSGHATDDHCVSTNDWRLITGNDSSLPVISAITQDTKCRHVAPVGDRSVIKEVGQTDWRRGRADKTGLGVATEAL